MYFYSVVVFTFIISSVSCANLSYNMLDVCLNQINSPIVVPKNSLISLHLILNQHRLNCSVTLTSLSPQFNFHFDSLNLPFDNVPKTCLDSVKVSDLKTTETSLHIWCRKSDLFSSSFTKNSPVVITISNTCLPSKCNYNISDYRFDLFITNYDEISRDILSFLIRCVLAVCELFAVCLFIFRVYKYFNKKKATKVTENVNVSDSSGSEPLEVVTAQQSAPDAFDATQLRQRNSSTENSLLLQQVDSTYGSFSTARVARDLETVEESNETQFGTELSSKAKQ